MATSPQAVANGFLELADNAGRPLTNMQLQKLVFLAQGYNLAILDRPIHFDDTYAWQWGPVNPRLYRSLQKYGSERVTEQIETADHVVMGSEESDIIEDVWEAYGNFSGARLSAITHMAGTPWSVTWEKNPFGVIDKDLIEKYYRKKLEAARDA